MGNSSQSKHSQVQVHPETLTPACVRLVEKLVDNPMSQQFYLVGGTALALQLGHRLSIDIDLFTQKEFNPRAWLSQINTLPNPRDIQLSNNYLYGLFGGVKMEMMYFAYKPYKEFGEWNGLKLLHPEDIGMFKLLAIIGRNRKKDIIDLYFIDKEVIPLKDLVQRFVEEYDQGDINLLKQLEQLFDDNQIEESEMPRMLIDIDWAVAYNTVKRQLAAAVRESVGI
jgi:hypothetical protein